MKQPKFDPQKEHRQKEQLRIGASATLADEFQELKSLEVELQYFEPVALRRMSHIKYTVNLAHARAVFSFHCPNTECVGGDFDLSQEVAKAVAGHRKMVSGEVCCQGWLHKNAINSARCGHVLRYALQLRY